MVLITYDMLRESHPKAEEKNFVSEQPNGESNRLVGLVWRDDGGGNWQLCYDMLVVSIKTDELN